MRYLKSKTTTHILVLAISALLVSCLVAPASAREYSIWEWWTDQAKDVTDTTDIHPPWGAAYSAWTHDDVWDQMDIGKEKWTVLNVPGVSGTSVLRVEYAGWADSNQFGWYSPTGGGGTLHQIFSGADNAGTVKLIDFSGYEGTSIGFYITTPQTNWYSEAALNSDTSTHVRVFDDPGDPGFSWVLAWEDRSMATTAPVAYNYADAWDKSKMPLTWYHELQKEPDYNDMIVTFEWVPRTPELSTFALLGLGLAAVPVLRRRRRS